MRAILLAAVALAACGEPETKAEAPSYVRTSTHTASPADALASMPDWDAARSAGVDFRAIGEPGWMLDVYQRDRITLLWDYGDHRADFPLTGSTPTQGGEMRIESEAGGHTLVITTRSEPCIDIMSRQDFPMTVAVTIDGRPLQGCGRLV